MISKPISCCRLCGSFAIDRILDLGDQPPANSLRTSIEQTLEAVPLVICRCRDCTTVQLTETVAPEHMFRDYIWVTGTSETACNYSRTFCRYVEQHCARTSLFVVEVASNDGTFLQRFREDGHRVLGVDPAHNLARMAEAEGVPTMPEFFGYEISKRIVTSHGCADVVIARNVLPHVPDPNDVVAGIAHCLNEGGVGAIEFHWVNKILRELHYDSIYHEHFFYHSLHSINELLKRHHLILFDVTESPISGGSLVAYFSKTPRQATKALGEKLALEEKCGLATLEAWQEFARSSLEHRQRLKEMVQVEIKAGRKLIGYGASARSSTLLNFCGVDHRHLICIADQSEMKHEHYTPGTNILIVSLEKALAKHPDTILLLAWNFRDEIMEQLVNHGFHGNVIIPLPNAPQLLQV